VSERSSQQTTGRPADPNAPAEPGSPATWGKRFVALVLDWILCLLVGTVLARLTGVFSNQTMVGFWAYPVLIVEYGVFIGVFGQTVGMRLARIACLRVSDHGRVGVPRALLRGFLLCLIVPPLVIGPGGRGLHDRAARSIVVHT
jgi:uncharacterized RDD family membrane protein YckC